MKKEIQLLVIFGGRSGEHEVSLKSAASIIKAAREKKFSITPVGITRDGVWLAESAAKTARIAPDALPEKVLASGRPAALIPSKKGAVLIDVDSKSGGGARVICRPDVVFPVLHGTYGEDGTIQGLFEMCNIPYVGPGVLGSAVAMDKEIAKRVMRDAGMDIVPFTIWRSGDNPRKFMDECEKEFGYPVFVKPANLGSSVGISKAKNRAELVKALKLAADFDRKVLVEKSVNAREIECAVLGNSKPEASVPGEVMPVNEFYDYEAKYIKEGSKTQVPADLPAAVAKMVRTQAIRAFQVLGCEGLARADFFLERETGRLFINELNTIPGFTSISMYPMMWRHSGLSTPDLIGRLVDLAIERHREISNLRTTC